MKRGSDWAFQPLECKYNGLKSIRSQLRLKTWLKERKLARPSSSRARRAITAISPRKTVITVKSGCNSESTIQSFANTSCTRKPAKSDHLLRKWFSGGKLPPFSFPGALVIWADSSHRVQSSLSHGSF